jgi:hypothetical protein
MNIVKQISVIIDNAPGTLARICSALRDEGINVDGFAAWGESDHGVVRIVCDRPLKALDLLEGAGMIALPHDIVEVEGENSPGVLFDLALKLHEAGVNINYAYGSTPGEQAGRMYLAVTDLAGARDALKK